MPAYNASKWIAEAIESVLNQTYPHWELIIVNDGSTDHTQAIAESFSDQRIKVLCQENKGVSVARNLAMNQMRGDFFCFLDADDVFSPNSLESRIEVFYSDPKLSFVDGSVDLMSYDFKEIVKHYSPKFLGNPQKELIELKDSCFFGLTWMIKREKPKSYKMREGLSHAEDLLFLIEISKTGEYNFTKDLILLCRQTPGSAMSNLDGLLNGYKEIWKYISSHKLTDKKQLFLLRLKIVKIMFLSYLKKGMLKKTLSALNFLFRIK